MDKMKTIKIDDDPVNRNWLRGKNIGMEEEHRVPVSHS